MSLPESFDFPPAEVTGHEMADASREPARQRPPGGRVAAWIALFACIATVAFAPPWRRGEVVPPGYAGRLVSGQLERQVRGEWVDVQRAELVPNDSPVRSATGAQLAVNGGSISLARNTRGVLGDRTTLDAGSLLTEVDSRDRSVGLGVLTAVGRGVWRVDVEGTQRIGVYQGSAEIRGPDDDLGALAVSRLFQAELAAGRLTGEAVPLRYASTDAWDARLLARPLAVDREVEQWRRSLTVQFGSDPRPPAFFAAFGAVQEPLVAALPRFGRSERGGVGPPADVLVAVVTTNLLVDRGILDPASAVEVVARLRQAGATWGIVLGLHNLGADDLRAAFDAILTSVPPGPLPPALTAPAPPGNGTGSTASPPRAPAPTTGAQNNSDGPGQDGRNPTPNQPEQPEFPVQPPPPPPPPPPCVCDVVGGVVHGVTGIVNQLLPPQGVVGDLLSPTGLVGGVLPQATKTTGELVNQVPTLLEQLHPQDLVPLIDDCQPEFCPPLGNLVSQLPGLPSELVDGLDGTLGSLPIPLRPRSGSSRTRIFSRSLTVNLR